MKGYVSSSGWMGTNRSSTFYTHRIEEETAQLQVEPGHAHIPARYVSRRHAVSHLTAVAGLGDGARDGVSATARDAPTLTFVADCCLTVASFPIDADIYIFLVFLCSRDLDNWQGVGVMVAAIEHHLHYATFLLAAWQARENSAPASGL